MFRIFGYLLVFRLGQHVGLYGIHLFMVKLSCTNLTYVWFTDILRFTGTRKICKQQRRIDSPVNMETTRDMDGFMDATDCVHSKAISMTLITSSSGSGCVSINEGSRTAKMFPSSCNVHVCIREEVQTIIQDYARNLICAYGDCGKHVWSNAATFHNGR